MKSQELTPFLPFSEYFFPLLTTIHRALGYCFDISHTRTSLDVDASELADLFRECRERWREQPRAYKRKGIDKHIFADLAQDADMQRGAPRLSKLCVEAFRDAQEMATRGNFKGLVIPSPLAILYQALTVPEHPQTAAYSMLLIRSMLYGSLGIHPASPILGQYPHLESFDEQNVAHSLMSFRKHVGEQARWPDPRNERPINFMVGHILAIKGYTHLWFRTEENLRNFCDLSPEADLVVLKERYARNLHFRLSHSHLDLPQSSEVINTLFGIPMPFRGGETLFIGALKKSTSGGLVVSLSGQPGVGKTSVALSLAIHFACIGTATIYVSLEEKRDDLFVRMTTLIPDYLEDLSVYKRNGIKTIDTTPWLGMHEIPRQVEFTTMQEVIDLLANGTRQASGRSPSASTLPVCCPLFIVVDNINELAAGYQRSTESYNNVEKFIQNCREHDALVVLVAGENVPQETSLDYLVDVAIDLKQEGTAERSEKPVRIFRLGKTRHQISRQGSHVFHLSGPEAFRISPQIPSQLDLRVNRRKYMPNPDKRIHTLNLCEKQGVINYLHVSPHSRILIHGYGSAGKAGLALKLVLSPTLAADVSTQTILDKQMNFDDARYRAKVLVVSFLYPEEYYRNLTENRLYPKLKKIYPHIPKPEVHILAFAAGFLSPEDFVDRIVRTFDRAVLDGDPYTGIVIDGLHNIFLQFKKLQDEDMVWPLLYNIFSRYRITVVNTFTNFSLNDRLVDFDPSVRDMAVSQSLPDHMLMQKGQTPFLHTLVKAADYLFLLEQKIVENYQHQYFFSVKSAIGQKMPSTFLRWDREELTFLEEIQPGVLLQRTSSGNGCLGTMSDV